MAVDQARWGRYLAGFHEAKAGITERLLSRACADGDDPFTWCADLLSGSNGPVLDIACGSGPLAGRVSGWVGLDLSAGELEAARSRGRGPVLRGSATDLPVRDAGAGAVVCSMGMQVIQPLDQALAELARVLAPDGIAALMVPAGGPLPWRDALRYLRLQVALRRRIGYPNDAALQPGPLSSEARTHGLRAVVDERRAFRVALRSPADVEEFVESLYLPGVGSRRLRAGRAALAARVGGHLVIPLRRIRIERIV